MRAVERMDNEGEERCSDARWESEKVKWKKAWNGARTSKSKRDRIRTKRATQMHLYTVDILPTQAWSRPRGGRRGAASDACYVEQGSFELLTSSDVMWAIHESRLECDEGRVLSYQRQSVDRVATMVEDGRAKGEERQARRAKRKGYYSQAFKRRHVVEWCVF